MDIEKLSNIWLWRSILNKQRDTLGDVVDTIANARVLAAIQLASSTLMDMHLCKGLLPRCFHFFSALLTAIPVIFTIQRVVL